MTLFAPDYYNKFTCIADKCKNNCCIGWEIDIDDDTLEFYNTKEDIIKNIEFSPTPHFRLKKNERCPFLNNDNLCEIIKNYGEERLCQICTDHPRFRNFFISRTEIGLGMCCEAATELIINNDFKLIKLNGEKEIPDQEETAFFKMREDILSKGPKDYSYLLPDLSLNEIYNLLIGMEKLSDSRDEILNILKDDNRKIKEVKLKNKQIFKRIFDYFVFRHLHSEDLAFCVLSTYIIACLGENIKENARMFSSEIEYSEENTDKLYNIANQIQKP